MKVGGPEPSAKASHQEGNGNHSMGVHGGEKFELRTRENQSPEKGGIFLGTDCQMKRKEKMFIFPDPQGHTVLEGKIGCVYIPHGGRARKFQRTHKKERGEVCRCNQKSMKPNGGAKKKSLSSLFNTAEQTRGRWPTSRKNTERQTGAMAKSGAERIDSQTILQKTLKKRREKNTLGIDEKQVWGNGTKLGSPNL